jgi:hypothetical protein
MKKFLVVAAAALVGAAALAQAPGGGWPRVYQYAASLNTAVAKNAKTVKYTDCEREMDVDVCYRVKGTVSVKGVIVFGCQCVDEEEYGNLPDGYPIILMATSADNYRGVTFAKGDVWTANRLGSPLSSKAKIAELGFDTEFRAGPTNAGTCVRDYELRHAGFGTAGMVESGDGYDITSISGTVIGSALAPYCSADQNTCPRCVDNGECQTAIAFEPCTVDDCAPYDGENTETGVAFGSFTVKYNKTLASAIKNIPTEEIQETIDVLVPKVFGKNAIAPTYANYRDYFANECGECADGPTLADIQTVTAEEDAWLTANPLHSKHDGGWVWSAREDRLYAIYPAAYGVDSRRVYRIDHIGHTSELVATLTYGRHGSHPVIDSDGIYVYFPPSEETRFLERLDTRSGAVTVLAEAPDYGTFAHGAWKNNRLWIVLDNGNLYNWNPATDIWTAVHNFGTWCQVVEHGTTASDNVYIWVTNVDELYSYDTVSGDLTQLADFTTSADLGGNGMIVYVPESGQPTGGFIYAMSGCSGAPRYYSIATDTWYELPDPHPNSNCVGHGTYDCFRKRLYVADGDSRVWVYQY